MLLSHGFRNSDFLIVYELKELYCVEKFIIMILFNHEYWTKMQVNVLSYLSIFVCFDLAKDQRRPIQKPIMGV